MISPQAAAQKWARNLAGATESIKAGINAVTEAPGVRAVANAEAYLAGVQRSFSEKKWQNNTAAVSLEEWKRAATTKGLANLQAGIQAGQPKMAAFMAAFMPFLQGVVDTVKQLPKGGIENGVQRAVTMMRRLAEFKYRRNGM